MLFTHNQDKVNEMLTEYYGFPCKASGARVTLSTLRNLKDESGIETICEAFAANEFAAHEVEVLKELRYLSEERLTKFTLYPYAEEESLSPFACKEDCIRFISCSGILKAYLVKDVAEKMVMFGANPFKPEAKGQIYFKVKEVYIDCHGGSFDTIYDDYKDGIDEAVDTVQRFFKDIWSYIVNELFYGDEEFICKVFGFVEA